MNRATRSECFKRALIDLDAETLVRLDDALDDSPHGDYGLALDVIEEIWCRWGVAADKWPINQIEIADDVRSSIVNFCVRAAGPDDPKHRPSMRIPRSSEVARTRLRLYDLDMNSGDDEYRCSCGRRGWDAVGRRQRAAYSRTFWPTTGSVNLGGGTFPEFYVMCPYAKRADDPEHAPWAIHYRSPEDELRGRGDVTCICNAHYGTDDDGSDDDMYGTPPKRMSTF